MRHLHFLFGHVSLGVDSGPVNGGEGEAIGERFIRGNSHGGRFKESGLGETKGRGSGADSQSNERWLIVDEEE